MSISPTTDNLNPDQPFQAIGQGGRAVNPAYHLNADQLDLEQQQINAAKKDPALFAPLYNKYYERIFRFCYQRMDDKDTAFDITAQVFLKAMLKLDKYEFRGVPFGSWLFRIALSELNQVFRQQKAQRTLNADTDSMTEIMASISEDSREEEINLMMRKLPLLDKEDLELIEMRFFEKRPFREIGEITGITENNAKVKTYRALDKLKKHMPTQNNK